MNKYLFLDEEEEEYQDNDNQKTEQGTAVKDLNQRLEDLQTCNDLIAKRGSVLQRTLNELETLEPLYPDLITKIKAVNEKATIFRIAVNAMINVSPV